MQSQSPHCRNTPNNSEESTLFNSESHKNGSGKSTLLGAIAAGIGSTTVGGHDIERDDTLRSARTLAAALQFGWRSRTRRGFFLRSEDFFNFAQRMQRDVQELGELAEGYAEQARAAPHRQGMWMAAGAVAGQRDELVRRYGENLDARSHGEGFLRLFQERVVPGGLYLLDEPEAALSPTRQLSLLSLMKNMVAQNSQFLVATHSPILMAFPEATILDFDQTPIAATAYDDLEHVSLMRSFLQDPGAFLRHL